MAKKPTAPVEDTTPAVEETEETERDYVALAAKSPSELSLHILDWIIEQTGVTFATEKERKAFAQGVDFTIKFRTYHQASPENQERLAEAKAAREQAKAEKAAAKAAAKTDEGDAEPEAKPAKAKGKTAAPVAEPEAATPATVAKAKGPVKAGAKPGKKAPF